MSDSRLYLHLINVLIGSGYFRSQAVLKDLFAASCLRLWLGESLFSVYRMAWKMGQEWATGQRLILLLDGLDELDEDYRLDCLEDINIFQAEYAAPMVVCSRYRDSDED